MCIRDRWYNRDMLAQAGVISEGQDWEPKNWNDILDACKAVKEKCPDVVPFWCNSGVATGEACLLYTSDPLSSPLWYGQYGTPVP